MVRLYRYVGPEDIRSKVAGYPSGKRMDSMRDIEEWLSEHSSTSGQLTPATFVIDEEGYLRLADRHSEHVACAGGNPVYCAGEMFFAVGSRGPEIVEISNQSSGYCPEPESWSKVQEILDRIEISHPGNFTLEVVFRRCPAVIDGISRNVYHRDAGRATRNPYT